MYRVSWRRSTFTLNALKLLLWKLPESLNDPPPPQQLLLRSLACILGTSSASCNDGFEKRARACTAWSIGMTRSLEPSMDNYLSFFAENHRLNFRKEGRACSALPLFPRGGFARAHKYARPVGRLRHPLLLLWQWMAHAFGHCARAFWAQARGKLAEWLPALGRPTCPSLSAIKWEQGSWINSGQRRFICTPTFPESMYWH